MSKSRNHKWFDEEDDVDVQHEREFRRRREQKKSKKREHDSIDHEEKEEVSELQYQDSYNRLAKYAKL